MNADNGQPAVGTERNMLGVRVPPDERHDISPDAEGYVQPGGGGLSVNPSIMALYEKTVVLIPSHFRHRDKRYKGARGKDPLQIFRLGEGDFARAHVTEHLVLAPDRNMPVTHGVIEPARRVLLSEYQSNLQNTRNEWIMLTEPDGS